MAKVVNVISKQKAREIGHHRFYCSNCKGYVLVKNTYGKIFCKNCNQLI